MSKHTFVRSTNPMGAIPNLYLGIQDGCHGILFCFIVSINNHEKFVLRVERPITNSQICLKVPDYQFK